MCRSQGSGELLAKEAISPSILLNPNDTLSPADFERKWLNMKLRYHNTSDVATRV